MKAAYLVAPEHVEVRELPEPKIGPGDALIRIRSGGICGSDISTYLGKHFLRKPPVILGHEVAGEVVEVGADVRDWRPGDRVAIEPQIACGVCRYCRDGLSSICPTKKMPGIGFPGLFSELVSMPATSLYRLGDTVGWEEGAMVEPTAVAYRAIGRAAVYSGARIAILGAGSIGALIAMICASTTDVTAMVVDAKEDNLSRVADATGYFVVNARDELLADAAHDITNGEGFDCVFLATSASSALSSAVELCRPHGEVIVVATYGTPPPTDLSTLVVRELSVKGTHAYNADDFASASDLIATGRLDVAQLITHRYSFREVAHVFDEIGRGYDHIKIMLDFA